MAQVTIRMPVGGGVEAELTRQKFEGLTADLFRRARLPLDQACWQVGMRASRAGELRGCGQRLEPLFGLGCLDALLPTNW